TLRLPHEELAGLDKHLKAIKKAPDPEDGLTGYTAELTGEGAKALARTEHRGVAQGGTMKFWVGKEGVAKYTMTIVLKGKIGNAEIDGQTTRAVTLRQVGTTKLDVPEAARKALQ